MDDPRPNYRVRDGCWRRNAMRELPIILCGEMVRAFRNCKPDVWPAEPIDPALPWKWQTRRVMKPQPLRRRGSTLSVGRKAPAYQCGDLVWVREAWQTASWWNHLAPSELPSTVSIWYCAKGEMPHRHAGRKRSGRYLPKRFAREWGKVVGVRPERLLDIDMAGILAEGMSSGMDISHFSRLWDRLNAKRGYPWESNPWVWVYEIARITHERNLGSSGQLPTERTKEEGR